MISEDNNFDDIGSDFSSLINDKYIIEQKNLIHSKYKYSKYQQIEIIALKLLPVLLFVFLALPFIYSLYFTIPLIAHSLTQESLNYQLMIVPFLYQLDFSFKVSCILGCIMFISIAICFAALINQRMSVPEYEEENFKGPFVIITAIVTFCLMILLFLNSSYYLSQVIGISNNFLYLLFMISSFAFSMLSYLTMQIIDSNTYSNSLYFIVKSIFIGIMMIMELNYLAGLSFLSYSTFNLTNVYNQALLNHFFVFTATSSAVYYGTFLLYVLSLQKDLDYLYMSLLIRPDIEYFVDFNIRKVL